METLCFGGIFAHPKYKKKKWCKKPFSIVETVAFWIQMTNCLWHLGKLLVHMINLYTNTGCGSIVYKVGNKLLKHSNEYFDNILITCQNLVLTYGLNFTWQRKNMVKTRIWRSIAPSPYHHHKKVILHYRMDKSSYVSWFKHCSLLNKPVW